MSLHRYDSRTLHGALNALDAFGCSSARIVENHARHRILGVAAFAVRMVALLRLVGSRLLPAQEFAPGLLRRLVGFLLAPLSEREETLRRLLALPFAHVFLHICAVGT